MNGIETNTRKRTGTKSRHIKWSVLRVIIPLLVALILLPSNLSSRNFPQVIIEESNGRVIRGEIIDVDIENEIILVKEKDAVSGIKISVSAIRRVRLRTKAGKNIGGAIKDLLVAGTVGYLAQEIFFTRLFFGERRSSNKFGLALLMGGLAFKSALDKDTADHYKYKNYKISKLQSKKYEYKRKKILAKLKKHSWRN
ncbi:MAG: hypothetical protein GY940_04460 [bacterium]|nr:hypothetical protein [bacterium]